MTYKVQIDDVIREANAEETARLDAHKAEAEGFAAQKAVKVSALESARAKLAALGLTEAEIKALVG